MAISMQYIRAGTREIAPSSGSDVTLERSIHEFPKGGVLMCVSLPPHTADSNHLTNTNKSSSGDSGVTAAQQPVKTKQPRGTGIDAHISRKVSWDTGKLWIHH